MGARYDVEVMGASLEIGRQIKLGKGKNRRWWLEPVLQAACATLKTDDYTTDNGIDVHVNPASSRQYRAQLRLGHHDRGAKFLPSAKIAGVYSAGSGGEVVADQRELQADFDGLRVEAGVGGSYLVNKRNQMYFEYEYAKADAYQRKWSINAGWRHAW
jgi:outer membrane autotransporter protein